MNVLSKSHGGSLIQGINGHASYADFLSFGLFQLVLEAEPCKH